MQKAGARFQVDTKELRRQCEVADDLDVSFDAVRANLAGSAAPKAPPQNASEQKKVVKKAENTKPQNDNLSKSKSAKPTREDNKKQRSIRVVYDEQIGPVQEKVVVTKEEIAAMQKEAEYFESREE